ncbi:MAG: glycosyltransferase family 2 protein [Clostridiales bacterium]|nr:glycosyltransferase family 2 protein [Clostridiales bacterium]
MTVTVFTPTFNRAYILPRLYESLCAQTCKDFEWIIVDDGSSDNTEELVGEWTNNDNGFDIIYEKKQNGGKHRAINVGVQKARGELFFIVDSDDHLTPEAVELLVRWLGDLDDSHKFAAISGARGRDVSTYIGGVFKGNNDYVDAKNTEREKHNLTGDKAEAYITSVLKKYPFPEFDGENFITEEVVWNAIAYDGYYVRWYKDIIYICDYLDDGLTKSGNAKNRNNPQGVLCWSKMTLKCFPQDFKKKLHAIYCYYDAVKDKKDISQIAKDLDIGRAFCCIAIMLGNTKRRFFK